VIKFDYEYQYNTHTHSHDSITHTDSDTLILIVIPNVKNYYYCSVPSRCVTKATVKFLQNLFY